MKALIIAALALAGCTVTEPAGPGIPEAQGLYLETWQGQSLAGEYQVFYKVKGIKGAYTLEIARDHPGQIIYRIQSQTSQCDRKTFSVQWQTLYVTLVCGKIEETVFLNLK